MTDLTKDEIVKMAREAGAAPEDGVSGFWVAQTEDLQRFYTLCRAPLVAEIEALREQLKALGVYNESTKAELARVRAGEPFAWARPDAVDASQDFRFIKIDDFTVPLYATPPQPAAQEPTSARPVVEQFLQDGDQHLLHSFIETTEDDEGYMLTKPEIKRLAELGVVQSHGFGKYSVTMFGHWVHERYWHQNPSLPLKTNTDRTADAAIAAGQKFIKENGK